jgi:hypothetical protein
LSALFFLSPSKAKPGEKLRQLFDIGIVGLSALLVPWIPAEPVLVESPQQSALL